MQEEKNKPYAKIKISSGVEIVFWKKEIKIKEGKNFSVLRPAISKSYKDAGGNWVNQSVTLDFDALFRLFALSGQCLRVEKEFKKKMSAEKPTG